MQTSLANAPSVVSDILYPEKTVVDAVAALAPV